MRTNIESDDKLMKEAMRRANKKTKRNGGRSAENAPMERLGMLDIILCEVLQGIREDRRFLETREEFLQYKIFATGGLELGILAAENYRK